MLSDIGFPFDESIYTITLADGTKIKNLKRNVDCFVSGEKIDESIFVDNTFPVTISNGTLDMIYEHAYEPKVSEIDGKYYFSVHEMPQQRVEILELKSQLVFMAMMSDINL